MSIFSRIFKIGQAEAHSAIDKLEDPVKMTEQGIRDLKKDLHEAMSTLAQVKAIAIRTRKSSDNKKNLVADYERKAMLLLQKAQSGEIQVEEAERLATEVLAKKETLVSEAANLTQEASQHEARAASLQENVNKIKSAITKYENELITLKARSKTAAATQKINQQMSKMNSSGTISMLEKMKSRVEEQESLAQAYGEVANVEKNLDDEINSALSTSSTTAASDSLLELKKKMGITS
ncbi:MAG: phage shock protein A [Deltaproteobacteria bacterium]|nr:MAG: phage shock protein A [Deltaproteobacteria bacterium]PIE74545.1 MAG: phage shock protein A [Deltaproteobacteria bacterium]